MADCLDAFSSIPYIQRLIRVCEAYTGCDPRVPRLLRTLRHYVALLYVKDAVLAACGSEAVSDTTTHSINLHLRLLEHTLYCKGDCPSVHCPKMKALMAHKQTPSCPAKCEHCSQKKTILLLHAKKCSTPNCTAQKCGDLKAKLAFKAADTIMAVGDARAACFVVRDEILDFVSMGLDISHPPF